MIAAELKLATQQSGFPAELEHQEEGSRQVSKMGGSNGAGNVTGVRKLRKENGTITIKINKEPPERTRKERKQQ